MREFARCESSRGGRVGRRLASTPSLTPSATRSSAGLLETVAAIESFADVEGRTRGGQTLSASLHAGASKCLWVAHGRSGGLPKLARCTLAISRAVAAAGEVGEGRIAAHGLEQAVERSRPRLAYKGRRRASLRDAARERSTGATRASLHPAEGRPNCVSCENADESGPAEFVACGFSPPARSTTGSKSSEVGKPN